MSAHINLQEEQVNRAFSAQAAVFDRLEESNPIIHRMRKQVREHVLSLLSPGSDILELNAGTGIDALYFAQQGFHIHATDNASGMLSQLRKKITDYRLEDKVTVTQCSFNSLGQLPRKKYQHIFSNFGGLNCTSDLKSVLYQIDQLLVPGGTVTLVIMPRISPWELISALKGNFKLAFRRLKRNGTKSNIEGISFSTYYYSPKFIQKSFGNLYTTISLKGLASVSPPPYLEYIPTRFPKLYDQLTKWDEKLSNYWPFNTWADHYMISLRKNK